MDRRWMWSLGLGAASGVISLVLATDRYGTLGEKALIEGVVSFLTTTGLAALVIFGVSWLIKPMKRLDERVESTTRFPADAEELLLGALERRRFFFPTTDATVTKVLDSQRNLLQSNWSKDNPQLAGFKGETELRVTFFVHKDDLEFLDQLAEFDCHAMLKHLQTLLTTLPNAEQSGMVIVKRNDFESLLACLRRAHNQLPLSSAESIRFANILEITALSAVPSS